MKWNNLSLHKIKWICSFIVVLLPFFCSISNVFQKYLAVTLWAIMMWMFELLPEEIVAIMLPGLYILFDITNYATAFSAWTILNKAVAKGYLSHQAGTCGLHVHISRNALGVNYEEQEATIAKILYFYEKFWNEILTFSRRTESQAEHWARRYGGGIINPKETLKHAKNSHMGRYAAVNLENEATIEMRIFRGTLKYNTFIATLQMVDEICKVAISLSDEFMQSLTWLDFVKGIADDKQELINYLKEKRLYVNEPIRNEVEI